MNCLSLIIALFTLIYPIAPNRTPDQTFEVSLLHDGQTGPATIHGWEEVEAALSAKGIRYEEVANAKAAHGAVLIAAGPSSGSGFVAEQIRVLDIKMPDKPESLIIHKTELQWKHTLLLSGSDDRGLMYALLEAANRIGWATHQATPLSKVLDTVESASVNDHGAVIFTMQKHQYEHRLQNENNWVKCFDTLADDRFKTVEALFTHEANGYNCPVYPYYMDVNGFPEVKVVGLSRDGQQRKLTDLHRLVRMAHERGIRVTFGIWCHYYHTTAATTPVDPSKSAAPDMVSGLTEANLVPYFIAAISRFLEEFQEIFNVQLLMMDESGLKTSDTKQFWRGIFPALKKVVPDIQYELRAKGVSDDLIRQGLNLGLRIWVNTKFWIEQVGLPFFRTHVDFPDQPTRPGTYASTIVDLQILSDLAAYHSYWSAAGMSYALFENTHDLNALDDAIQRESDATAAWAGIVRDAGDVYNFDLMMGLPQADLSGHWRDELLKLKDGLATLKKQREQYRLEARRVAAQYDLGNGPNQPGYQRIVSTERAGGHLVTLDVPDGRYEVNIRILRC